jgi:hypothetical protein
MSGEISWEEETEVREVIADIRDPDCELNWYSKILTNELCPLSSALIYHRPLKIRDVRKGPISYLTHFGTGSSSAMPRVRTKC